MRAVTAIVCAGAVGIAAVAGGGAPEANAAPAGAGHVPPGQRGALLTNRPLTNSAAVIGW